MLVKYFLNRKHKLENLKKIFTMLKKPKILSDVQELFVKNHDVSGIRFIHSRQCKLVTATTVRLGLRLSVVYNIAKKLLLLRFLFIFANKSSSSSK